MVSKFLRFLKSLRGMQRVNFALERGNATSALRNVDVTKPSTWEFSGFSQNGEDGIIDVLTGNIKDANRYFIEIGASDGTENNTAWLSIARRFSGIWVEAEPDAVKWCKYFFTSLNYGVEYLCMFVTKENAGEIKARSLHLNPDVLSLDIDGNDYYVTEAILLSGLRPKIFVVEYNSSFGPEMCVSIPYDKDFRRGQAPKDNLYYGCSIAALKSLFNRYGYHFVTVEMNGVNAFFIDRHAFDENFHQGIKGDEFKENFSQLREYRMHWKGQFDLIRHKPMVNLE